jgi:alkanesulfonate monooxygenase SsuD/methylene tetrahydromethanopterin reductase-like flavin-dependent oxidoreductase (luciferase family)
MVAQLKEMTEAAGRQFSDIQIAPQYVVHLGRDQDKTIARYKESQMYKHFESLKKSTLKGQAAVNSEDVNLIGTIDAVVSRAQALREAGVTHFLGLFFAANSVPELLDQMQMFAEEVRPKVT